MLDTVLDVLNKLIDEKEIPINHPKFKGSVTSTGKLAFVLEKDAAGDIYLRFSPDSTLRVTVSKFIIGSITGSIVHLRILKGNKRAVVRVKKGPIHHDVEINLDDVREALANNGKK